jgi:hypothetical protein
MKTHREKEGLLGPVHTMRVHVEKLLEIERPLTGGQMLEQMITYDSEGRKIEETTYEEGGDIASRKVYFYDQGVHPGWSMFDSDGSLLQRSVCVHDSDGKRAEDFLYGRDGHLERRQVRYYDKDSKQCEETCCTADGMPMLKYLKTYDDQERIVEQRIIFFPNLERSEESRTVFTYSDAGNTSAWYRDDTLAGRAIFVENTVQHINEVTSYDALGVLRNREIIERLKFDDYGNWTEERVSTWVAGADTTEVEPTELHHRTITYHLGRQ